jgi:hypothetical protein
MTQGHPSYWLVNSSAPSAEQWRLKPGLQAHYSKQVIQKMGLKAHGWAVEKLMQLVFSKVLTRIVSLFFFLNHGAFANDALVATRMTLNEKPWPLTEKYQFRDN